MTEFEYIWQIDFLEESVRPVHVATKKDCITTAIKEYMDHWGNNWSVYSIRKKAVTERFLEDEEDFDKEKNALLAQ